MKETTWADTEFFQEMLSEADGQTTLLSDDDPSLQAYDGEYADYAISFSQIQPEAAAALPAMLKDGGFAADGLFLSAYAYLLRLLSGQKEVLFFIDSQNQGTDAAGALPIFLRIDEAVKGLTFVRDTQARLQEIMAHASADVSQLVEENRLTVDIAYTYHRADSDRQAKQNNAGILSLHLIPFEGDDYTLRFDYAAYRFREDTVRRMAELFGRIVVGLCADQALGEMPLVSESALQEMEAWNATEVPCPATDVVSLFRVAAERYADRPAVVFGDHSLSYREVDECSERIAGWLRARGISRGDVVSVLIPRCEYMATVSLGVLKAGAAYQPLDPSYPVERLSFMMKDADCKLLVVEEGLLDKVPDYRGEQLLTKDIPALPECEGIAECPTPEDLFILLYTSGSTGTPKGVMLEHGNLANFCAFYRTYYDLTPDSRVAAYASYGFDACMMDLYPALTSGAAVCIVDEETRLDLTALEAWFDRMNITHAFITTQMGRQFYTQADPRTLKYLSVGGEKLVPLPPKAGGLRFINCYGPTECTIFSTVMPVDRLYERVPIGKPVSNYKCYVVDENLRRLPPLVPGELLIAGRGVGRGYLNRPDLTEKAFIQNPFCAEEGYEKAYRTGDTVRLLPDGNYDILGRSDGQVKVRGFRIELSEVEMVIRDYPGIYDATVQAFEDENTGEKYIAAYVVSDRKIDTAMLSGFIRERKPAYMVPSVIMQIDAIPLNPNQKVNRKALPKPEAHSAKETDDRIDNVLEIEMKQVVGEILGARRASFTTPLEEAGMSSIGFIRLAAFIYKRFGIKLPIEELKGVSMLDLENQLLSLWMSGRNSAPAKAVADAAGGQRGPCPLSASQTGVYMECVKNPNSTVYNIPVKLTFPPDASPESLIRAVQAVMSAHPSLMVHFDMVDNQIMTVPNARTEPEIPVLNMTEAEAMEYADDFFRPFDLRKEELFAFAVTRTKQAVRLLMSFQHLIVDGFTLNLFLEALGEALSGKAIQQETADYADYVREQQTMLEGEKAREYEAYFARIFENYDAPTRITPDQPKTDRPGESGLVRMPVSQAATDRALQRTNVSEAAFYLAALNYTVARLTNSDQVYLSTISSGRSDVRFTDTYGMFVNTLPLASELTPGSVDEFIQKTADDLRQAIEHENYPFAAVASKWNYSVELMYAYQRDILQKPRIPGLLSMEEYSSEGLMFPLFVRIVDDAGSPMIEVQYDDSLYSPELAGKIGRFMNTVITRFAEDGNQPLRRISLLDAEEEARLTRLHTEPETVEVPEDTFFFTGLERSAAQYPDRTAVIAVDGTFTYREFDEMTDRVANALIKRGAKPGAKALVLLPRNSRALAAFFGASKAGLGYIPFDPDYPVDRVNMVIEDSEAQFVITNAEILPRFEGRNAIDIEELLLETDTAKPRVPLKPENISYMIFTSGSTGRPKGVMLTHRAMAHYVADMPGKEMVNTIRAFCSVYCSITTLSFDISVMEYSLALIHGLTLVLASEAECNDPDKLARRMIETNADLISGTPSRIYGLLRSDAICDALRQYGQLVICGGEKYPEQLMLKLKTLVPRQLNIYGPSEITISCNEHDLTNDGFISLGRPTPGVTEYIVDTDGNELPVGLVGEVWIGGWGVGLGYNKLPEMTAERFIPYHGDRIYKSGDYGRWLPNGYLEILGRKDNQIKLRGLRIELGEVETVLAQQPGMKEVAVKIEKINGIEHLCAWFTNDEKVDIPRLKTAIGRTLTPYMVPTAYRQMDKMPYTPNGKLDLKNLPAPEVLREAGDAPRTQVERDFCEIFGELLHLDHMTATENFFDLGGTSLLVTQVIIEADKRGYPIVYADVFAHPTPRALAMLFEKDAKPEPEKVDEDIESYDYSAIHQLLAENTLDHFRSGASVPLGNVLLTGATGYLGIHVLHELLEHTDSRVYCLVRGGRLGAENRLKELLMYYFESPKEELFGRRIFPLEGDITSRDRLMRLTELPIDTVINCAASVKHFAHDDSIERINLGGVRNLIDFCLEKGAKLIQTSTTSVLEIAYSDHLPEKDPDEHTLYFGQDLTNQYVHSKFLAEREVLEAVVQKGLKAKIMRYGNLSARYHDGEFQINFNSNSAMGNLRALALLKCVAYDQLGDLLEFTPIDYAAKATVILSQTPEKCVLFHVLSEQYIRQDHLFRTMQAMGHLIDYVERSDFEKALSDAQNDPRKAKLLTSLIAYTYGEGDRKRQIIPFLREHTLQVLYRLGFSWPTISQDYFSRFIDHLNGLGYFDDTPGQ